MVEHQGERTQSLTTPQGRDYWLREANKLLFPAYKAVWIDAERTDVWFLDCAEDNEVIFIGARISLDWQTLRYQLIVDNHPIGSEENPLALIKTFLSHQLLTRS